MAAKKKATSPTQVDAIVHADKRTNIPTADVQDFVGSEVETVQQLRWQRDPSLDPQLVWKGKDSDADELVTDVPPIYIQEKIDPRVLIENLRDTAATGEDEPEMRLFDGFDGLTPLDMVEFYQHEANWSNRMILGDSLQVMGSLAEREGLRGKVQMIYIDPPYGIKFGSNWQVSTRKRDVKDGKYEDATFEVEQIKAFRDTWELGIHSYLRYLRDRVMIARELLSESGSVFVQIGDENVHLVRALLDEVFGSENYVAHVMYRVKSPLAKSALGRVADHLLWYCKESTRMKSRVLFARQSLDEQKEFNMVELDERRLSLAIARKEKIDLSSARFFTAQNLASSGYTDTCTFTYEVSGKAYPPPRGHSWKTTRAGMENLRIANRLVPLPGSLRFAYFFDDFPFAPFTDMWTDTYGEPNRSYVVQTSAGVIQRCMLMCTDPGDLVIDPTCGSGTTAYVAEQWGRRWITCDTSRVAIAIARQRLMSAQFPFYVLADSPEGKVREQSLAVSSLPIGESQGDIRRGFVYERVQHITLKSIANNPDIREGMSRQEIDEAIKRHADFELLYDRPYEDKNKVRVAGPFTVESLSPYRSIAFAGQRPVAGPSNSEAAGEDSPSGDFESMILENLRKAGIQNGRKNERLKFASVESYAGTYLHAIGEAEADDAVARRIGIMIGPQYGTVGSRQIMEAAKEAVKAIDIDLLVVLAFAFDPLALGSASADGVEYTAIDDAAGNVQAERQLGKLPVLFVRMNNDLVMGDNLKKTGAGNLFTVFGEPDIDVQVEGDQVKVEVLGVDVYDPSTGVVRSQQTDQVAMWMIDTDYNGESFFVRQCYFTGGGDPYSRLRVALKADIEPNAWAQLYSTTSQPFAKPKSGSIAIKVINDYGDEVMKVVGIG